MIHGIRRTKIVTGDTYEGESWLFPDRMLLIFQGDESVSVRKFATGSTLDPSIAYVRRRLNGGGWHLILYGRLDSVHASRKSALRVAIRHYRAAQFAGTL